jgi:hypothetical protein
MAITLRNVKGSELTHNELDQNFIDLRDGVALQIPKTQNSGIKVDSQGTPTYPWHDLIGTLNVYGDVGDATRAVYRGGIKVLQCDVSDQAYIDFHMPHDYLMGSDIHIHTHWSHDSATVTGGSVTWAFELVYAKGHDQHAFTAPVTSSVIQNASTTQYQHMVAETLASTSGGAADLLDSDLLEPDGLILCRVYLGANDITDSVTQPSPFLHAVDIHYQSTTVGTKQKSPDFWT